MAGGILEPRRKRRLQQACLKLAWPASSKIYALLVFGYKAEDSVE